MVESSESSNEIGRLADEIINVANSIRALVTEDAGLDQAIDSESQPFRAEMRRYHANGEHVDLSEVESLLLEKLLNNDGRLVSKSDLCVVLGLDPETQQYNLKSYVFRLKAKLSRMQHPDVSISAIHGAGYCITRYSLDGKPVQPGT